LLLPRTPAISFFFAAAGRWALGRVVRRSHRLLVRSLLTRRTSTHLLRRQSIEDPKIQTANPSVDEDEGRAGDISGVMGRTAQNSKSVADPLPLRFSLAVQALMAPAARPATCRGSTGPLSVAGVPALKRGLMDVTTATAAVYNQRPRQTRRGWATVVCAPKQKCLTGYREPPFPRIVPGLDRCHRKNSRAITEGGSVPLATRSGISEATAPNNEEGEKR
jgi:hypothetical protein